MEVVDVKPTKDLEIKVEFDGQVVSITETFDNGTLGQELKIHAHIDMVLDAITAKVNNAIFTSIIGVAKQFLKLLAADKSA